MSPLLLEAADRNLGTVIPLASHTNGHAHEQFNAGAGQAPAADPRNPADGVEHHDERLTNRVHVSTSFAGGN